MLRRGPHLDIRCGYSMESGKGECNSSAFKVVLVLCVEKLHSNFPMRISFGKEYYNILMKQVIKLL
jgi:hypothetical protein